MATTEREVPIVQSVTAGVVAYGLGYVAVYAWVSARVRDVLGGVNAIIQFFGGDPIPVWKAVGWLFYNAHFVATTYPGLAGGRGSRNFVGGDDVSVALYLVPAVVLFVSGWAVARYVATDRTQGAMAGVLVAVGYLPLAVIGAFVVGVTRGGTTIGPDFLTAVLLAGLVYPLVLGGLGGLVGGYLREP